MFTQALFPNESRTTARDHWLLVLNALSIGLRLFANLAFEEIGLDLYIVALLAAVALLLFWRKGPQPLQVYFATAYS